MHDFKIQIIHYMILLILHSQNDQSIEMENKLVFEWPGDRLETARRWIESSYKRAHLIFVLMLQSCILTVGVVTQICICDTNAPQDTHPNVKCMQGLDIYIVR